MTARTVDIVVPAQVDARLTRRCVASILAARNDTCYEVIVVANADAALDLATVLDTRDERVSVLREGRSLDYAGLVNRAFARHEDRDVVILQADAEVAGDWLDRLVAHGSAQGIGVVGTFTNAAGCATYPQPSSRNAVPEGCTRESLDRLFATVNARESAIVPWAYGPCLYIARACLAASGGMKPVATDDGHASEIDFTLRVRAAGFETRIAGDTFVRNDGEGSLGGRAMRIETHAATPTLAHLHPGYAASVRESIEDGRLRLFAGRVDIARLAASPRPAVVFVSHAWGGGIRRHMDDVAALLRERADVLYLEPAGADTVKLHWPRAGEHFAAWFRLPDELAVLAATLQAIGVVRLHFHHVHGLPQAILQLPEASGVPYDCTLHDYYAICPQYHLAGPDGRYCGEPDEAGCTECVAGRPVQWNFEILTWRRALGTLVRGAARVIAPSHDVAARVERHLPGLTIDVWSHPERPSPPPQRAIRVVTLGNLSREKGLDVVARCADDAKRRRLPLVFRVLGSMTEPIAQSPDAPLTIHGSYDEALLPQLLAGERADVLFFPAQVPETYSYTLSVALATPTPIVASALGALPERLAGRVPMRLVPFDATAEEWNAALLDAAAAGLPPGVAGSPSDAVAAVTAHVPLGTAT